MFSQNAKREVILSLERCQRLSLSTAVEWEFKINFQNWLHSLVFHFVMQCRVQVL